MECKDDLINFTKIKTSCSSHDFVLAVTLSKVLTRSLHLRESLSCDPSSTLVEDPVSSTPLPSPLDVGTVGVGRDKRAP